MTTTYTLTYFDVRGRAEPIRLLLNLAAVPFEDVGLTYDQWGAHRATAPQGQLPYLTESVDGVATEIPQTMAIVRHLARVHGLDGRDERERLRADVAAETALDLRVPHAQLRFSPAWNDDAARAKFAAEVVPTHLARLDRRLGDAPWFASEAPTYADVVVFDVLNRLLVTWPEILAAHPRLAAFADRLRALPKLAGYLAHRRPA